MTLTFLAPDRSVAADLDDRAVDAMRQLCVKSRHLETGGILVGRYSDYGDRVVITKVTGPPRDSRRFAFAFIRGIAGLTKRLSAYWSEGLYYVGEWHFHPFASPKPSPTDINQIKAFAATADLRCPRPVLIVLGGDPEGAWSIKTVIVADGGVLNLCETKRATHYRKERTDENKGLCRSTRRPRLLRQRDPGV
jgi:integrative and conjugative element protein (TIGR02256 family)